MARKKKPGNNDVKKLSNKVSEIEDRLGYANVKTLARMHHDIMKAKKAHTRLGNAIILGVVFVISFILLDTLLLARAEILDDLIGNCTSGDDFFLYNNNTLGVIAFVLCCIITGCLTFYNLMCSFTYEFDEM